MNLRISQELATIIPEQEVQSLAEWLSGFHDVACTQAVLVAVSFEPRDSAKSATSSAVLTLSYGEAYEDHHLCYVFSEGDNHMRDMYSSEKAHICWLSDLRPDDASRQEIIKEAQGKQA